MTLMLHCGAREVSYDSVRAIETPPPTATHVPVPHHRIIDMVRHTLAFYGHEVIQEQHALTEDGMRYFGIMMLKSVYGDYEDTVALRNSHDKTFPIGLGFGGHVFICDNLSLWADRVIKRKHTAMAKRDLPMLISQIVEPLADARDQQNQVFGRYRATPLTDRQVDHAIMELYREDVIPTSKIGEVWQEFAQPSFDQFGREGRTAWRLFNAATFVLNGRVVGKPSTTQTLHRILDELCVP